MKNLIVTLQSLEFAATEVIFNACRANPDRQDITVAFRGVRCGVTFALRADGTHQACVRGQDGIVFALADIDAFDC